MTLERVSCSVTDIVVRGSVTTRTSTFPLPITMPCGTLTLIDGLRLHLIGGGAVRVAVAVAFAVALAVAVPVAVPVAVLVALAVAVLVAVPVCVGAVVAVPVPVALAVCRREANAPSRL